MKPTAEIIEGEDGGIKNLWMKIDGEHGTMWAIEEGEIEAIRDACNRWIDTNKLKK